MILGWLCLFSETSFHNLFAQAYQEDPAQVHAGILAVDWIDMPQFTFHLSHMAT